MERENALEIRQMKRMCADFRIEWMLDFLQSFHEITDHPVNPS